MRVWQAVGSYGVSALVYAIDHCLSGQKAKTEYLKAPIIEGEIKKMVEENNIQRQREEFVRWMETMQANFEAQKAAEKLLKEQRGG